MSQPTGAPPEQWEERKDRVSRKIIERIEQVGERLDGRIKATDADILDLRKSVNRRMKTKVSYFALISLLGGGGATILGVAVSTTNQARKELMEARKSFADDVRQVRAEQAAKIEGIYNYIIEGKSKAAVREEVQTNLTKIQEATDGGFRPKQTGHTNQ